MKGLPRTHCSERSITGQVSVGHPARIRRVSALQGMAVDSLCPSAGRQKASRVKTQPGEQRDEGHGHHLLFS